MARLERHCLWERGKTLPHFTVVDYVLLAPVSRQGKHRKLVSTWTGAWRVVDDDKVHVNAVQHLLTAELRDVHVVSMRFHTGDQLEITGELQTVSHQLRTRASTTSRASRPSSGLQAAFVVKLAWEEL